MRRLLLDLAPAAALVAAILALAGSCGSSDKPRQYNNNDLELLTSYAAKEICSCVFVMGRDDDFCGAWAKASPNLRTYHIDHESRTVSTQAVLFWGRNARYVSFRRGCVLE